MRIKTSLFIEREVWREIKKAAIDAGQTVGEFVAKIFVNWRCSQHVNGKPAYTPSGTQDRPD